MVELQAVGSIRRPFCMEELIMKGRESDLSSAVVAASMELISLSNYPELRAELTDWLKSRVIMWQPLVEGVLRELGVPPGMFSPNSVDYLMCWLVLMALAGVLDTYVDQDKEPNEWLRVGRGKGTFLVLAVMMDCFELLCTGKNELRLAA